MNLSTIEAFDRFAEQYAEFTFSNILQFELNKFISLIPNNAKIIDLACGSGRDVQYFLDEGLNPIGIDASENMIMEAKKLVSEGNFKIMDMKKLNFEKESFDAAWALDAISYLDKSEIPEFLNSLNSILKNEAVVFFSVRLGEGAKEIEYEKLGKSKILVSFFSQKELENLLIENNFEVIDSFTQDGQDFTWINVYARKLS